MEKNSCKAAICVDHVSLKYYNGVYGIRDISVALNKGELIALIGANGAGKSTFLNVLCGLLQPTEGDIYYDKKIIDVSTPFHQIGWSKQTHAIDWYLNVYDNVFFGARMSGMKKKEAKQRTLEVLELVGLLELKDRDVDALSGGQQQRVQIARALVHNASILILDEPTTGLDAQTSENLLNHLRERANDGVIVIVSSHDLNLVDAFCDKVLLLKEGKIVTFESKQQFLARYVDKEVLTIAYEGDLPPVAIQQLEEIAYFVENDHQIRLEIAREMQVGTIIRIIDPYVRVVDIKRDSPGLREAYLEVAREKGEVTQG
ncbi:ABC transporter ATP-binding protein [Virgibacillus sp. 179-BFC.A HS]|uniref:ABC transporter ATP-binding protein n=1 Tax=Tigheibacillus jepli TaxID=3035914 RepID=A0ABU5CGG2_9BACI|nr:ABC transporter ATP-binding protein [Virgibacillus sp. 179-BFC.A HS]MDY0405399.1 ABC transporter ATP-binding protein [Virgibacillus sp. 179-BFC.A HS]